MPWNKVSKKWKYNSVSEGGKKTDFIWFGEDDRLFVAENHEAASIALPDTIAVMEFTEDVPITNEALEQYGWIYISNRNDPPQRWSSHEKGYEGAFVEVWQVFGRMKPLIYGPKDTDANGNSLGRDSFAALNCTTMEQLNSLVFAITGKVMQKVE